MRPADQSKALSAVLAGVKHGSHICAFYETDDDLIDLVLPFLSSRANQGELCVWMMPDSLSNEARFRTGATLVERGIEPYQARDLYLKGPHFEYEPVKRFWDEKLQESLDGGHSGLCASGDTFWLRPRDWKSFLDYEADLNNLIADKPITLLCTYPLSVCKAGDLLDVARAHQVALSKRHNSWEVIKAWGPAGATTGPANERHVDALDAAERISLLSLRMRQVLDALAEGRLSKELAHPLGLSVRTVELHRARMLDRLGVRTAAEAVRLLTLANLVMPP
ncbi:MAG: Bacterial regulatory, luxR family protein [Bradyrhizobium sp.]|nr:Bacterial regulatory, luxR family protein [Bradyrhizobium sp.]